jgi:hypothetical protein
VGGGDIVLMLRLELVGKCIGDNFLKSRANYFVLMILEGIGKASSG